MKFSFVYVKAIIFRVRCLVCRFIVVNLTTFYQKVVVHGRTNNNNCLTAEHSKASNPGHTTERCVVIYCNPSSSWCIY